MVRRAFLVCSAIGGVFTPEDRSGSARDWIGCGLRERVHCQSSVGKRRRRFPVEGEKKSHKYPRLVAVRAHAAGVRQEWPVDSRPTCAADPDGVVPPEIGSANWPGPPKHAEERKAERPAQVIGCVLLAAWFGYGLFHEIIFLPVPARPKPYPLGPEPAPGPDPPEQWYPGPDDHVVPSKPPDLPPGPVPPLNPDDYPDLYQM